MGFFTSYSWRKSIVLAVVAALVTGLGFAVRYGEDNHTFGTSYWFRPHVLLYLDERGLDRSGIFKALQPEVTSRKLLQDKLSSLYPEYGTIIGQAFDRYDD